MKSRLHIAALAAATLFSTGLYTAAYAADEVVDASSQYDWSGFYMGIQGGGAWLDADGSSTKLDLSGGALGGYAGYNWQNGNVVFGIEADVNHAWADKKIGINEIGVDWQGAFRARLGYAIDNALIYGTGGVAITRAYAKFPRVLDEKETLTGWTVGAGVEYAFTQNWTTRLDYRYSDYGGTNFGLTGADDVNFREHAVRVGVGYKF